MGQYYKPVLHREDKVIIAWACSHEYGNGLKLMEHSWIGNNFVAVIENLLLNNPTRVTWCGDYADTDKDLGINEEAIAEAIANGYENNGEMNYYDLCDYKGNAHKEVKGGNTKISKRAKYVINHTTKEFIDKTKIPVDSVYTDKKGKEYTYIIHPLPLMTCNSNGAGGGDFFGNDPKRLVGKWGGNEIEISTRKPKGFTEIEFNLVER